MSLQTDQKFIHPWHDASYLHELLTLQPLKEEGYAKNRESHAKMLDGTHRLIRSVIKNGPAPMQPGTVVLFANAIKYSYNQAVNEVRSKMLPNVQQAKDDLFTQRFENDASILRKEKTFRVVFELNPKENQTQKILIRAAIRALKQRIADLSGAEINTHPKPDEIFGSLEELGKTPGLAESNDPHQVRGRLQWHIASMDAAHSQMRSENQHKTHSFKKKADKEMIEWEKRIRGQLSELGDDDDILRLFHGRTGEAEKEALTILEKLGLKYTSASQ